VGSAAYRVLDTHWSWQTTLTTIAFSSFRLQPSSFRLTMLHQLKHVALTYLTWRWIWFVIAITALFVMPTILSEESAPIALGMPSMMGLIWIAGVVKWQFVNPRARLLPGYTAPHLGLFAGILLVLFVINPLAVAAIHNMNAWGLLSFALLLAGCVLMAILLGRGPYMFVAIAIFFSSMNEHTRTFWFENASQYAALHVLLTLVGGRSIGYCLWYLTHLTEEMDEYQILPMGSVQVSRVERAEQRKLLGNQIKKQWLVARVTDRWLDRKFTSRTPTGALRNLAEYGLARTPSVVVALFAAVAFTLYAVALMNFGLAGNRSGEHPPVMLFLFAMAIPPMGAGMVLLQHRTRMGQELLRPASRTDYVDGLLGAIQNRSAWLWAALHVSLPVVALATDTWPPDMAISVPIAFALLSLATQVSAFGLCLHTSLWNSMFGYIISMYAVAGLQMGTLALWRSSGTAAGWPAVLLLALVHLAAGAGLITWARRRWLDAELA